METLLTIPPTYPLHKLKTLPLRDQPAYRVTSNAAACSLAELLAAVVGGATANRSRRRHPGPLWRGCPTHLQGPRCRTRLRSAASASRLRYASRLPWRSGCDCTNRPENDR